MNFNFGGNTGGGFANFGAAAKSPAAGGFGATTGGFGGHTLSL